MSAKHYTFFGKIFRWLKTVAKDVERDHVRIAIQVTNRLKDCLASPVVDIITSVIPTNIDDDIVKALRAKLPVILASKLVLQSLNKDSTEEEVKAVSRQIISSFGGFSKEDKEEFYTSVAAKVYMALQKIRSGKKVTYGQAAAAVEADYRNWETI